MAVQNSVVYQIWARRITLATTLIVVVLSWINAVRILDIIVRGGISFGVMYLLMAGILSLFEKTASQEPQNKQQSSSDAGRGGVIDFSVGDDELRPQIQHSSFPGQVDPSLSKGLPGSKQQAEIVRRMGWDDENK
ncbi:MAG TPA: hypothetical protein VMW91_04980 [Desulfosporosinus sp.]|nr:hypothetical protein [Desulfosporosinus sp.]